MAEKANVPTYKVRTNSTVKAVKKETAKKSKKKTESK